MGKKEIDLKIKLAEIAMEKYIKLSSPSIRDDERYKATLEQMRMKLSSLYMEKENFNLKNGDEYGKEES